MMRLLAFLLFCNMLNAAEPTDQKLNVLYNSLNPTSTAQHLAFYELYGNRPQGKQALRDAMMLLSGGTNFNSAPIPEEAFLLASFTPLISLINHQSDQELPLLSDEALQFLEKLASRLPNRRLKGHEATSEEEVLKLTPDEIDLARGLFLSQFGDDIRKVRTYEAMIDLMALQIQAKLSSQATPATKIEAINRFIFEERGFRFPPHSIYAKDVDLYTFLSSVLESRRGVCLGISVLYLCLAQRLALPIEIVTPPGHIYVRYHDNDDTINIETTARGIHVDSEEYLGVETKALQQRNMKEVIGMTHFNHASIFWQKGDFASALTAYQRAEPYMPDDAFLKELMGYAYLLTGNQEKGKALLIEIKDHIPDYGIDKSSLAEDYLQGNVDNAGIAVMFDRVDETRESILKKKMRIEEVLTRCPRFRSGIVQLATTWLQLHRSGEALAVLEQYHQIDPTDATVEYYLAELYSQRFDYNRAWEHLRQAEHIVHKSDHHPKALKKLRQQLSKACPE